MKKLIFILSILVLGACGKDSTNSNVDKIKSQKLTKLSNSKESWDLKKKELSSYSYSFIKLGEYKVDVDITDSKTSCRKLTFDKPGRTGFKELGDKVNSNKWGVPIAVTLDEIYTECAARINKEPIHTKVKYVESNGFILGCSRAFDQSIEIEETSFSFETKICEIQN